MTPSVVNPNYLHGSMALSGLAAAHGIKIKNADIVIVETHPKVLYFAQTNHKYRYSYDQQSMNRELGNWLGLPANTQTDHEWDALISALAAMRWITKEWTRDLHTLPARQDESLVSPIGKTHFCWPTQTNNPLHRSGGSAEAALAFARPNSCSGVTIESALLRHGKSAQFNG